MATFGDLPTEVAQKCVEFLAFEEATEVKCVSRGLRKAARWALTRGRWRPIRFVSEHGLDTLKKLRGGLNSLDDGVAATFRAAWALDPGLVMRVIHEDMVDDYHGDAFQAVFLNIVEPSIEGVRYAAFLGTIPWADLSLSKPLSMPCISIQDKLHTTTHLPQRRVHRDAPARRPRYHILSLPPVLARAKRPL